MNKVTLLAYHRDYEELLKRLRDVGVVHVGEKKNSSAEIAEIQDYITQNGKYVRIIKSLEPLLDKGYVKNEKQNTSIDVFSIVSQVEELLASRARLAQNQQTLEKEIATMSLWGDFDYSTIDKLSQEGYVMNFFQCVPKQFDSKWIKQYNAIIVNELSSRTYFVTLTKSGETVELEAEPSKLSAFSLSELNKQLSVVVGELNDISAKLKNIANTNLGEIKLQQSKLLSDMEFSKVLLESEKLSNDKLVILEGWIPEQDKTLLQEMLDKESVFYELRKPQPDDNVPIKFNNNKFFSMFEPICELYMLPRYNELDLTPFFAPFYMIFFGLCLGDMGYGLVMAIVSTVMLLVMKNLSKSMTSYMRLVLTLGVSTIICGSLTGTFFGFNIYEWNLPFMDWWRDNLSFSAMNPKTGKLSDPNPSLFNLSLILGGIQIFYGMVIKVVNTSLQLGFKYALSTVGWIIILLTAITAYVFPELNKTAIYTMMAIGAIGVFLLNSPGKNPVLNVGLGLWDTYGMVTGLLGDILSYVRLFALGLSGGILAMVFNSLATGMKPDNVILGPIVMVLIFLIGHFINMFMNVLGALVHPMRLTFVEFFKNAGYEGGGKPYKPFRTNITSEKQ